MKLLFTKYAYVDETCVRARGRESGKINPRGLGLTEQKPLAKAFGKISMDLQHVSGQFRESLGLIKDGVTGFRNNVLYPFVDPY